jgi:hypothetical protein
MSNYTKSTNFATKDNLTPGDPLKIVRGTEIDTEFNNIATAIATKTDNASAAITGGTINDTTIGATTASTGAFTTLGATGVATFSAGSAGAPAITTTGDTNTGMFFPAADTIAFAEGGAEIARFDTSGNLGLGVTPSAWGGGYKAIDVQFGAIANTNAGSVDVAVTQNAFFNGSNWITKYTGASRRYVMSDGGHSWFNGASQTAGDAITFTQAMTLDASGNLGVGTTSPSARLSVSNSAGGNVASFTNTSSADLSINLTAGVTLLTPSTGILAFGTSSTERARIDSSGNLMINQTSGADGKLNVTNGNGGTICTLNSGGTSPAYAIQFKNTNGTIGDITVSGTTTAYNTSSDYRLKNTITPMTGALAKVALLKPCRYKWNADGSDGEGFIAHELAEVVPQCVTGEKDAVNEDGNPQYQGIDTSFLVATLTAALQEAHGLIKNLETRISALEAK